VPNVQVASPFDCTVYSSVWSSGIVTLGTMCPLNAFEGAEDMLR